jgi:hypothetical protein
MHYQKKITECETRSVTPTSELADMHTDIDKEFAAITSTKTFTSTTKTSQRKIKSVHKRA